MRDRLQAWAVARAAGATKVLDLRPPEEFVQRSLLHSTNIPRGELLERYSELPPPGHPFIVVVEAGAARVLPGRYGRSGQSGRSGRSVARWQVMDIFEAGPEFWEAAEELLLVTAPRDPGASVPHFFLWEPCPLLKRELPGITARLEGAFPGVGGLRALDVGCGAGRDSVYLASQGYRVKAVDNQVGHLRRVESFAARNGVEVATVKLDVKKDEWAAETFNEWEPHLVVVVRFLHRPLLGVLMRAVHPGGCLVYEHFKVGAEAFGSPSKAKDLLKPGELRDLLVGWVLAVYDEGGTLEDGRPMVRVVAFKPL